MARRKNLHPQHKVTAKSLANLRPIRKGELSKEQAKERGSKGGKSNALKFQNQKQLVEALMVLLNKRVTDSHSGEQYTMWEAALSTAGKAGLTNGKSAMEFIKLAVSLLAGLNPQQQTINVIQTKDKQTIANELTVAQDIISKLNNK